MQTNVTFTLSILLLFGTYYFGKYFVSNNFFYFIFRYIVKRWPTFRIIEALENCSHMEDERRKKIVKTFAKSVCIAVCIEVLYAK